MIARPPRPDRQTLRRLRRADALLAEAERVLHDLPDHLSPTDLLARIRLHNAAEAATPPGTEPMHESIIVHGPPGSGKTLNAVAIARHFGLSKILDDQDPAALPPGVGTDTLILTSVDLTGTPYVGTIRCVPYAKAACDAGVFNPVNQTDTE